MGFTEFSWILLGFTGFHRTIPRKSGQRGPGELGRGQVKRNQDRKGSKEAARRWKKRRSKHREDGRTKQNKSQTKSKLGKVVECRQERKREREREPALSDGWRWRSGRHDRSSGGTVASISCADKSRPVTGAEPTPNASDVTPSVSLLFLFDFSLLLSLLLLHFFCFLIVLPRWDSILEGSLAVDCAVSYLVFITSDLLARLNRPLTRTGSLWINGFHF